MTCLLANDRNDPNQTVNCFSIDVESFSESNVESFAIPASHLDPARQNREIEMNVDFILDFLAGHNLQATFFFLGRIARDLPRLVRRVAAEKHEIACHGWRHLRLYGLKPDVFAEQLRRAKGSLEDAGGQAVVGFRAPDFSITRRSLWALDALRDAGFLYDSSIYPFAGHDVYGIGQAPTHIYQLANGLIEWPLATMPMLNRRLPFGGGGYLRLYPARLTELCFSRLNRRNQPCMFYIHPYEMGPVIEAIPGLSPVRRFRHYFRCGHLNRSLYRLLGRFRFASAIATLRHMGYIRTASSPKENAYV